LGKKNHRTERIKQERAEREFAKIITATRTFNGRGRENLGCGLKGGGAGKKLKKHIGVNAPLQKRKEGGRGRVTVRREEVKKS